MDGLGDNSVSRRAGATHIAEIDGLRALAVLAVLAFHGGVPGARGGFLGVSLFFTLSGFMITRLLLDERRTNGRVAVGRFWERRVRRLAPAALLTIIAVVLVTPHLGDGPQQAGIRGDAFGALAYGANWRFLAHGREYADLFGGPSPLLHFWSLAIEEQFYIVFPLLMAGGLWLLRGRVRGITALLAALFAGSVALQFLLRDPNRVYLGTETRAAELLAGALLAAVLARGPIAPRTTRAINALAVLALAAFAVLVMTTPVDGAWLSYGGLAGIALVNVALVAGAVAGVAALRPLRWRPLVAIGAVSYGIYLFHWPVFVFVTEARTGIHGVGLACVRLALVGALATLSYHLLECPIRYRRALVTRPRLAGAFAVVVAGACVAAVSVAATPPTPLVDPSVLRVAAKTPAAKIKAAPPLRVMVVGDETARPFASGLGAQRAKFTVLDATRPGCPFIRSASTRRYDGDTPRDTSACAGALETWLARAKQFKPELILVMNATQDAADHSNAHPPRWENPALVAMVNGTVPQYQWLASALRGTGAVVAWADVPHFTVAHDPAARNRAYLDRRVDVLNDAIMRVSVANAGVTTLDFAAHVDRPFGVIDLHARPDGIVFAPQAAQAAARGWFANAVLTSYRAGRQELGLPVADDHVRPVRVLVGGDSTSLNVAAGLMEYGRATGTLTVEWAGQIGCPVVRVAQHRMQGEENVFTGGCTPFVSMWAERGRAFKPDVVLILTTFVEASDIKRSIGGSWLHLGEPAYDTFVAPELDAIADAVSPSRAPIAWATAPYEEAHEPGDTPALNTRLRHWNQHLRALAGRRHNVRVLPFRERVDAAEGPVDRANRPDGIHFTVPAGRTIAERWLARALLDLARAT
jgi:peptidoglycan/LPS O-acetylase OafA/YrhL